MSLARYKTAESHRTKTKRLERLIQSRKTLEAEADGTTSTPSARDSSKLSCSTCGSNGHNTRTCSCPTNGLGERMTTLSLAGSLLGLAPHICRLAFLRSFIPTHNTRPPIPRFCGLDDAQLLFCSRRPASSPSRPPLLPYSLHSHMNIRTLFVLIVPIPLILTFLYVLINMEFRLLFGYNELDD